MISIIRFKNTYLILFISICFSFSSCAQKSTKIKVGAEQTELYLNLLKGKNIAVVANQTSVIEKNKREKSTFVHLVDSLISLKINVTKVFSPEHGFRGKADAGAHVEDGVDAKTGLPILSLHGKSKKPSAEQLKGLDVIVFDIQDVGVRFYTYISTLHFVMEAAAESGIPVIVFDRPNPNGHYIDGPVLEMQHSSFVGKHPVPVVYGMTIGEYGKMINGEKWLKNGIQCDLTVIPLKNYKHNAAYSLPIKPSPNLPNDKSINLYPSLGFFEGTTINAGRGTSTQFQMYGAPFFGKTSFYYTPKANEGATYPKHKNKMCNGIDLRQYQHLNRLDVSFLIDAYKRTPKNEQFFGKTFTIHAGTKKLQQQLENGVSEKEIRKSWKKDLNTFKKIRMKYLIYN